jgi:hypothetical protein
MHGMQMAIANIQCQNILRVIDKLSPVCSCLYVCAYIVCVLFVHYLDATDATLNLPLNPHYLIS